MKDDVAGLWIGTPESLGWERRGDLRPGTIFRHASVLDPSWTPGPGERWADAPKALCRITAIRHGAVYYKLGTEPGRARWTFELSRAGDVITEIIKPQGN